MARIGQILVSDFGNSNLIARWGGEEFIVALNDTPLNDANVMAEQLRMKIELDPILNELGGKSITVSIGVTTCQKNDTQDSIFHRLDDAMYKAKKDGKNKVASD